MEVASECIGASRKESDREDQSQSKNTLSSHFGYSLLVYCRVVVPVCCLNCMLINVSVCCLIENAKNKKRYGPQPSSNTSSSSFFSPVSRSRDPVLNGVESC